MLIKQYQPEFVEQQYKLGKKLTQSWSYYYQTPVEGLKKTYSRPDFNPETRLYAFEEDRLLGFITAQVMGNGCANIAPAICEDKRVAGELMRSILQVLESKRIPCMTMTYGKDWEHFEMMQEFGFVYKEDLLSVAKIDPKLFSEQPIMTNYTVRPYTDNDQDQVASILSAVIGYSVRAAQQILSSPNPFQTYASLVLEYEGVVVGWLRAQLVNQHVQSSAGYIAEDSYFAGRPLLFKALASKMLHEKHEIMQIQQNRTKINQITWLGKMVEFEPILSIYEKIDN